MTVPAEDFWQHLWSGSGSQFNLRDELLSTVMQTLLVAPLVSLIVRWRQKISDRRERIAMIPQVLASLDPIRQSVDAVVRGPDGDLVKGGLEIFARQFELQTPKVHEPEALKFYLGHPQVLTNVLADRLRLECDHVDGLLDLFAPHLRTTDAVVAQELRSTLRQLEAEAAGIAEATSVLASGVASASKFLTHLVEVDQAREADASDEAGRASRQSVRTQAFDSMVARARGLVERFDSLPRALDQIAAVTIALVEGLYDNRAPFEKVVNRVKGPQRRKPTQREPVADHVRSSPNKPRESAADPVVDHDDRP